MASEKMRQELKRLLLDTASGGSRQLTEVETDLVQTNILLGEAIQKLGSSFMELHNAVLAQQQEIELVIADKGSLSPEDLGRIKEIQEEITLHVNASVTGLQFQDMTSQLLERIVRRVIGLRDALGVLSANSFEITPDSSQTIEELEQLLKNTVESMEDRLVALENGLWKTVRQTRMESGDIELF